MKVNCYIILYTLLFSLSHTSCSDECEREVENLKDLNKYVPYRGTETLRFLHNSTDTQTFIGQGMERFFVSTSDEGCITDHESVRIRFKNTQSNDEINMEYVFDDILFQNSAYFTNSYTSFKFYFNNAFFSEYIEFPGGLRMEINGLIYDNLDLYSITQDTSAYFLYKFPEINKYNGILKIKYPNDTLEIIQ